MNDPGFPSLGPLVEAWVARHCMVPAGKLRGKPFVFTDDQYEFALNHYRVLDDAVPDEAFVYRRSQYVGPQKAGKSPCGAAFAIAMGCGPDLFAGFAGGGERWLCDDWGCGCGWAYSYAPGEPMGARHPSPMVQILGYSEDQIDTNAWGPLKYMIRAPGSRLGGMLKVLDSFVRVLGLVGGDDVDRIDRVTNTSTSRLGNPVSGAVLEEGQLFTKSNGLLESAETVRRGASAIGGRTMGFTNPPDPAADSYAWRTMQSKAPDVYNFWRPPPVELDYLDADDRRLVHEHNYKGCSWVSLRSINAEADELILDGQAATAERFYGNRVTQGSLAWMNEKVWSAASEDVLVPDGEDVCLGFDGSDVDDWTALRGETRGGHQFTPRYAGGARPCVWDPSEFGGRIPRESVIGAIREVFSKYRVARLYVDPFGWQTDLERLALELGVEVVLSWPTNRVKPMWEALTRFHGDAARAGLTHDGCPHTTAHMLNAVMVDQGVTADGQRRYILGKPRRHLKIDAVMSSVLAHEAAADMRALGWAKVVDRRVIVW